MNKKILISLSVIAAVAALAIGGTIAYFSDIETSTGNTFTAGSLDLIVDINGVVQNPLSGPIFTVTDMKPGDSGEKTISLTVDDNPACGFVNFNLTSDKDNSCTEPEIGDEPGCVAQGTGEGTGELNDNVVWTIWSDMGKYDEKNPLVCPETIHPGDNKYNPECGDVQLTTGNLISGYSWSIGELPVSPTQQYYGIKWELPAGTNNIVQTDSFAADMILSALQKRNQFPTGCPALGLTD
jgi:predicted ribosomally synthesized peptide with SipW-like signal peptide